MGRWDARASQGRAGFGQRLSRRGFLRAAGRAGVGVAGLAIVGCGGDDDDAPAADADETPLPAEQDGDQAASVVNPLRRAPAGGSPVRGGSLTFPISLLNLDFFDSHRAQFPTTQLFASLQQSKLVRYADIDAGVLEPDLAGLPEIPDEETYVFLMRPGARWWDREPANGRRVRADDVRLNIERQIAGLDESGAPDPTLERQSLFERTASVEIFDEETVVLRTQGADSTYVASVAAGPWSFIQPPEVWDLFGDALRDSPLSPQYFGGSGPFQIDRFLPGDEARFVANETYFREGSPLLAEFRLRHQSATDAQSAYVEGEIDVWPAPHRAAAAAVLADRSDDVLESRPLPFGLELAFSFRAGRDNPFVDPRPARAVHMVTDRQGIVAAAYGNDGLVSGPAPWYTPGWATAPAILMDEPGYRRTTSADRSEARALLEAAQFRGPLRVHLPDVFTATHPAVAATVEANYGEALGVRVEIVIDQYPRLLEGIEDGSVPVSMGWGTPITDPDPTDRLEATMTTGARGNRGAFSDPIVDTWIETMRATLAFEERQRIFHEGVTPSLLSEPGWALPIGHGVQLLLHRPEVHLPPFGFGWDGYRWEEAWVEEG